MSRAPGAAARFEPPWLLRNSHVQSLLASAQPRRWFVRRAARGLERASVSHVLDCGAGVRLQGFHLAGDGSRARDLVILLHGWEGSARSTYMLSAALRLAAAGYAVFRLNFRDHGDTHHLNEGLFHSCRLDEVVGAVRAAAALLAPRRLFLVGFSLGGNFALRVALRAPRVRLDLHHAVAVSPAIDPAAVLLALERAPAIYERHFLRKWRRSLLRKRAAFPARYGPRDWAVAGGLREQTRLLIERHHRDEFPTLEHYLRGYSIAGARLVDLRVPATVVAAADDPVVPIADLLALDRPPCLDVEVHRRGGHCGFLDGRGPGSWIDRRIAEILDGAAAEDRPGPAASVTVDP